MRWAVSSEVGKHHTKFVRHGIERLHLLPSLRKRTMNHEDVEVGQKYKFDNPTVNGYWVVTKVEQDNSEAWVVTAVKPKDMDTKTGRPCAGARMRTLSVDQIIPQKGKAKKMGTGIISTEGESLGTIKGSEMVVENLVTWPDEKRRGRPRSSSQEDA
jgi:hypothetical protein